MTLPKSKLAVESALERAEFAGRIAAAANDLAKAARAARDADAEELLRQGERPAVVARAIGILSPQIARMKPADRAPTALEIKARADAVKAALDALDAIFDS